MDALALDLPRFVVRGRDGSRLQAALEGRCPHFDN